MPYPRFPVISAEEAASNIPSGATVAFSGFSSAGAAKAVPRAIAMNTALEVDLYGNTNSTHVCGSDLMNGIGGSMDFSRNGYISFIMCPSISKGGKISNVVPMCSHVDNTEHSVSIIVTDQGLADLRGFGPAQRAKNIIEKCAHPAYRPYLHRYLDKARMGHLRHNLRQCFELHNNFLETGAMLPELDLSEIERI